MSATPESNIDLVAVACVIEASLAVGLEWARVLNEYVYPLLKRLNEHYPAHQFRVAVVTYGPADTRPCPLLCRRFFAPLTLATKDLREEPTKLGIGQTNSGGGRGLSALEGLVAAIEFFDILMASTNFAAQTQSPQKETRSLISHILHIAATPPDNVQKPQYNVLHHLDAVNWESIPAELRKRKINFSLINLRKIPQFQELYSSVAGPGVQSPWFNVYTPHILLLAGFPTPQKGTKRQTDAVASDQSPDTKRQKVAADSKTSSASPVPVPARIPQRSQAMSSQATQPPPTTSQNSSSAQSVQPNAPAPTSTPVSTSSGPTSGLSIPAGAPEQGMTAAGLKFSQMTERIETLKKEILALDLQISNAQSTGQTALLAGLQTERATKVRIKEQILIFLWQHFSNKSAAAKEAPKAPTGPAGSVPSDGSVEAGPSTLSHPPSASGEQPAGAATEEHKPPILDPQALTQFWQSRGGTSSAPNGVNPPGPSQPHPAMTPELAAQMQKLIERRARSQMLSASGPVSQETGVRVNATNSQPLQVASASTWNGTFSWTLSRPSGQVEIQIHVSGIMPSPGEVRMDTWPKSLMLQAVKEPIKDMAELQSWLKSHQPRIHAMQFKANSGPPDGSVNEQKFQALHKFMSDHRIYAYTGWHSPSGKFSYNIFIFPMGTFFAGAMFPEGLTDLPGGNALDIPTSVEATKPQPSSGPNLPPALLAQMQMQGLDPAQRQHVTQLLRVRQEQLRRQQLQAQQQHNSSQAPNSLGMSMPANPYGAVANVPAGSHAGVNGQMNVGGYNTGGGTVNYEMLQSFMQRSAEGSAPPQGMNTG